VEKEVEEVYPPSMQKVFVGLSGGVDSGVSAALLKEQGYEVTGCFIKIWQPEFIECSWREDRLDAMRVAASLGVPFCEIDLSDEYKKEVVDGMVADYARGITPNPDVLCNTSIKFGHFLRWALAEGADYIATGHYARVHHNDIVSRYELLRGKDGNKDQSYFLWQLGQEELSRTIFPVGELTKHEVRALAKRFGLPNSDKPDSQGLCFVGDVSMEEFLARFIPLKPGPVEGVSGKRIGEHQGAALYTIGQRHGFSVGGNASVRSHYVVSADTKGNTVVVSENRADCERKEAYLTDIHWISHAPTLPFACVIQARYREAPIAARVQKENGGISVRTAEPHIFSPGQSLVLFQGDTCFGGGVISVANMR